MPTAREIMEGCFRGEKVFIDAFHERYKRLIYDAIHSWMREYGVQSPEDVGDIFKDFFIKLLENNFASLRRVHDIDHPTGLIYLAARQYTGRYFKRQWIGNRRKHKLTQKLERMPGVRELPEDAMLDILKEAIAELDEDQQNILELLNWGNLTYRGIATQTGLSVTNVGAIINRTKREIRDFIRREYPELRDFFCNKYR